MASVHQACLSLCPCSSTVSFHSFRLVHIICTAGDNIDPLHHSPDHLDAIPRRRRRPPHTTWYRCSGCRQP
ncbi:hypothetical protein BRADI_4g41035v3 [Brachypodium distachyon]|uniref:Uncharacterized protein n=1 Tax=Brachypodium distachyon TaxID=15368 RepID=A0A2K2CTJ1_BRADI|nr:hypothetical protein BRADI_4g41035v3 [Brachypodium distachyon]